MTETQARFPVGILCCSAPMVPLGAEKVVVAQARALARAGFPVRLVAGSGVDPAGDLSSNWVRSAVDAIAQRELDSGGQLPVASLKGLLADTSYAPRARRVAYELTVQVQPELKRPLVERLLNDPSLELRRDAVAYALSDAKQLLDAAIPSHTFGANRNDSPAKNLLQYSIVGCSTSLATFSYRSGSENVKASQCTI